MTEPPAARRRFLVPRRWGVFLAVAGIALLVIPPLSLLVIRSRRIARLQSVVDARKARHLPTSLEDLSAMVSRLDPRVQAEFGSALRKLAESADGAPFEDETVLGEEKAARDAVDHSLEDWILGMSGVRPEDLNASLGNAQDLVEEVTSHAREGRAVSSILGWLPKERPGGVALQAAVVALDGPSVAGLVRAIRWHGNAALLGDDPDDRLDDLDALLASLLPVGDVGEALLYTGMQEFRDRVHVLLAIQGRLSQVRQDRFLAEDPDDLVQLANATRAESWLFAGLLAEDLLAGRYSANRLLSGDLTGEKRAEYALLWFAAPASTAESLEIHDLAERILRGEDAGTTIPRLQQRADAAAPFFGTFGPLVELTARNSTLGRARGRASRLAVRLLRLREKRGRLPADEAEARAWLGTAATSFDSGPRDLRLRYEQPAEGVFRISVDPSFTPPLLIANWGDDPPVWLFGKPPSARPFLLMRDGVEIRLPR